MVLDTNWMRYKSGIFIYTFFLTNVIALTALCILLVLHKEVLITQNLNQCCKDMSMNEGFN